MSIFSPANSGLDEFNVVSIAAKRSEQESKFEIGSSALNQGRPS